MSNLPPGCTQADIDRAHGYYDYEPEDECAHEDYEADILTGRASCNMCGYTWYQTNEEIEAEQRQIAKYEDWQRRENRREFWRRLTLPIRWPIYRALQWLWPRKSCSVLSDDEIPF